MLTLLFDGVAYGMLLFVLSVGLSVTLGLMNFINLAHGAFAMMGGYCMVYLFSHLQVPFLICLPVVFVLIALLGAFMERVLYRRMYNKSHLDQVLFSIGLSFMSVATMDYFVGSSQQTLVLPEWLQGRHEWGQDPWTLGVGNYRLFIVLLCAVLTLILQTGLSKTRFGSQLRASVDDPTVASGLGGALGAEILSIEPMFHLKYMIYFLIVVAVGGTSSITGPLYASMLLGVADVFGKYYIPQFGGFIVYVLMIVILLWRPQGLFTKGVKR